MSVYNHLEIEKKWQQFWEEKKTFSVKTQNIASLPTNNTKKFYALDMFPFPSGAGLHVGHPEGYTATDIICRKKRMEGFEVLHPMGWDAFGLPAENFAIKTGVHPKISTDNNIKNFTRQIKSLGFSYDWNREFSTTDEEYYKWTQWIFLKLYEKGLLYEDEKPLNWCPSCKVVCANEEVEQGLHERCGNAVTKKSLKQWMFKITEYAERLLEDLEKPNVVLLHGWGGAGTQGWFGQIKKYLEENGIEVIAPNMPGGKTPNYEKWKEKFDIEVKPKLKRNSIVLGHSLGCGFLQRYLTEENIQVAELVFVAPTVSDCGIPEISNFFTEKFNYEKIKNSADNIFVFGGDNDPCIPKEDFAFFAEKLSAHFEISEGRGHFSQNDAENPELLAFFEKVVASQLDWPEKIKAMQRNWIGRSTGIEIEYPIVGKENEFIHCYTTRPDTNFGATFVTLAPEHKFIQENLDILPHSAEVKKYVEETATKSDIDRMADGKKKTGVFTGMYVLNRVNNKKLPLYVGDFVLAHVGTGAVVGVPGHDMRDFEFAQAMGIDIIRVVISPDGDTSPITQKEQVQEEKGMMINSEFLNGLDIWEAKEKISDHYVEKGWAKRVTNYRLRDWIFTRQRYWGEPIPLVFDENGKCYPLDESELPLVLPESANYEPSESGESPLAKIENWVNVKGYVTEKGTVKTVKEGDPHPSPLPEEEGIIQNFRRETSTMPNWAGSSWYYLRFMDAKNPEKAWSKESENFWGPVDLYVGGAEHAVLHLLYARFWHKALYDLGLVSTKEPFKKLVNQGLILSYAYQRSGGGLVPMDEVEEKMVDGEPKYFEKSTKEEVKKIVAKMSKSLKNVVNPDEIIEAFGADTLRMYEMFMGPFEQSKAWDTSAVEGMHKFLARIHRNFTEKEIVDVCPSENLVRLTHQTVKKVSDDIDAFKFNTAISQLMIWMNEFSKLDHIPRIAGGRFVRLLAPFAPHLAEELWQKFSPEDETISFVKWPSYDEKFLVSDSVVYAVQVNGKLRADFEMPKDATKEEVLLEAKKLEKVQKYLSEGEIRKEIFVPGKIVGFVVN